jgi:prepilin-type N-terminal cleavage/methylation domain-containing protein
MNKVRHSKSRQGKSLIELIVVISVMSIVIGMSATSLATLYRLHQRYASDAEQALAIDRLADRLRADAHEAVSAMNDGDILLKLTDGRSIRYSFERPRIIRQVKRDDAVWHRDTFAMPRGAIVEFEKEEADTGALIRLLIRPGELKMPARELPRSATIEAAIGFQPSMAQITRQP